MLMENRFLRNKIIIKYCKDYYKIINERFSENDKMSDKVIQIYQSYIFSVDEKEKNALKRAVALNNAVNKYFEDREFRNNLNNHLKVLKAPKDEKDILLYIVNSIIMLYNKYLDGYTRNLYIPRWI